MAEQLTVEEMKKSIKAMDNEIADNLIEIGNLEEQMADLMLGSLDYVEEDLSTQGFMVILGSNDQLKHEIEELLSQIKTYQYGDQDSIQMGI